MALSAGTVAPDFRLPSTTGSDVALSDLRGKKVVLFFYPRDLTPGCTTEACDFRDRHEALLAEGAVIFGISKDSLATHEKFRAKHELPFPLLTDADNAVATLYEAYGQKMMYGKQVMGTIRSTYLVDEEGKIAAVWSPVRVAGHAEEVLAVVRGEPLPEKKKAPARKKKAAAE